MNLPPSLPTSGSEVAAAILGGSAALLAQIEIGPNLAGCVVAVANIIAAAIIGKAVRRFTGTRRARQQKTSQREEK